MKQTRFFCLLLGLLGLLRYSLAAAENAPSPIGSEYSGRSAPKVFADPSLPANASISVWYDSEGKRLLEVLVVLPQGKTTWEFVSKRYSHGSLTQGIQATIRSETRKQTKWYQWAQHLTTGEIFYLQENMNKYRKKYLTADANFEDEPIPVDEKMAKTAHEAIEISTQLWNHFAEPDTQKDPLTASLVQRIRSLLLQQASHFPSQWLYSCETLLISGRLSKSCRSDLKGFHFFR